jgi:hypothetical protein
MKTSTGKLVVATNTAFSILAARRSDRRGGAPAALLLLIGVLQLQLFVSSALAQSSRVGKEDVAQSWSVQVDRVDPGDVGLEPSFKAAIYENLLEELAKTAQFKQLFRSGDRNANELSSLLILKTTVQNYAPGSETRRAVTTVTGATKLNVRVQLVTRDGHVVFENVVDGNVRFIGGNLRATHNLARNVAQTLKRSTLPENSDSDPKQEIGKTSK